MIKFSVILTENEDGSLSFKYETTEGATETETAMAQLIEQYARQAAIDIVLASPGGADIEISIP